MVCTCHRRELDAEWSFGAAWRRGKNTYSTTLAVSLCIKLSCVSQEIERWAFVHCSSVLRQWRPARLHRRWERVGTSQTKGEDEEKISWLFSSKQTKICWTTTFSVLIWFVLSCFAFHVYDASIHQVTICYAIHCCASLDRRISGAYGNAEDCFEGCDHQKIPLTIIYPVMITYLSRRHCLPNFSRYYIRWKGSVGEKIVSFHAL